MLFDWTSLTNPREALNFVFKKDSAYDAYQKQNQFVAVALTDGMALTADQAGALSRVFAAEAQDRDPGEHSSRLFFKGRILGENSPHSFLPDPCDLGTTSDENYAAKLITMHTTFVTTRDANFDDNQNIEQNDLFNVILGPGSAGQPFNLQLGKALGRSKKSLSRTSSDAALNCESLASLFQDVRSHPVDIKTATCDESVDFEETTAAELDIVMIHPLGTSAHGGDVLSSTGYRAATTNVNTGETGRAHWHSGLDFNASSGPIYASHDGTIKYRASAEGEGYGTYAIITGLGENKKYSTIYAHMDSVKTAKVIETSSKRGTSAGLAVLQGDIIGHVGKTGNVEGPHLHWEVRVNGSAVGAPETYILFDKKCEQYTPE